MQDLGRRFGNAKVLKVESKKESDDKNPFKAFSKMPGNLVTEQIKVEVHTLIAAMRRRIVMYKVEKRCLKL